MDAHVRASVYKRTRMRAYALVCSRVDTCVRGLTCARVYLFVRVRLRARACVRGCKGMCAFGRVRARVCVRVHVCVCVCINARACACCECVRKYVHVGRCVPMCTSLRVCEHEYARMCVGARVCSLVRTWVQVGAHVCAWKHVYTHGSKGLRIRACGCACVRVCDACGACTCARVLARVFTFSTFHVHIDPPGTQTFAIPDPLNYSQRTQHGR